MRVGGDGWCGGAHGESIPPENNALRNFYGYLPKGWVLKNDPKNRCAAPKTRWAAAVLRSTTRKALAGFCNSRKA